MDSADHNQDVASLPGLHRLWALRRHASGLVKEEEHDILDVESFPPAQNEVSKPKSRACSPAPLCYEETTPFDFHTVLPSQPQIKVENFEQQFICLDAGKLKDIPAKYTVPSIEPHEFPAVGVYIDPRIATGFKYRVRRIENPAKNGKKQWLFGGRALGLQSIGRGYSRRMTFAPDNGKLNDNPNYFWTDSNPSGFAFQLEVISVGDKFTIQDANHMPLGTLEVQSLQSDQEEVSHVIKGDQLEKSVRASVLGKIEWFENDRVSIETVSGIVVCVKGKYGAAKISKVFGVKIGADPRRGFILTPGIDNSQRTTVIRGTSIGDIPTTYTIFGLESNEMPVIGTYVDPRIVPGFSYRVRHAGTKRYLFGGQALPLLSVGIGYGKRITFAPNPNSINSNSNYFWSDTHPDGLGFEPRAISCGMKFDIHSSGNFIGHASVSRTDAPQEEIKQEVIHDENGKTTIVKHIHVDVTCDVVLDADVNQPTEDSHSQAIRVSGTAVVVKTPGASLAKLVRVENIGLNSKINVLFLIEGSKLVFYPVP
ncbi:unnamed protein product [Bemisia tabaci]|uniref:Uncharacterized protein n=1 Tax=Bemisia tabaci TaxID=7038 RepID=A0A9P0EZB8_BEMTA|nr:unnamed protein product [Bemisia tabaci]